MSERFTTSPIVPAHFRLRENHALINPATMLQCNWQQSAKSGRSGAKKNPARTDPRRGFVGCSNCESNALLNCRCLQPIPARPRPIKARVSYAQKQKALRQYKPKTAPSMEVQPASLPQKQGSVSLTVWRSMSQNSLTAPQYCS